MKYIVELKRTMNGKRVIKNQTNKHYTYWWLYIHMYTYIKKNVLIDDNDYY